MITYFRAISLLALNGQRLSPLMNRFLGVLIWRWSSGRAGAVSQNDGARKRVVDIFVSVMMFPMEMGGRGGAAARSEGLLCPCYIRGLSLFLGLYCFCLHGKRRRFLFTGWTTKSGCFPFIYSSAGGKRSNIHLRESLQDYFVFLSSDEKQEYSLTKSYYIRGS